jgi:lipopolysaccharide export system permease protein
VPWTLYRYILWDLVKQLVISTAVLVLVISFAVAIKPLSDGLLGPVALVKFVLYTAPTMLQYALPFSGAFASTMVFARMTTDNEVLACSASGMSYRKVLAPVLVVGLALMLGMVYLSNWVVPRFFALAARTLQRDITRVMVAQLQKHQAVQFGHWALYADEAQEREVTPAWAVQNGFPTDPPARLVVLRRAAVIQSDAAGNIRNEVTAKVGQAVIFQIPGQTRASLVLENATRYDPVKDALWSVQTWHPPDVPIPSPFSDHPRFLSLPDLERLQREPESYDRIAVGKRQLTAAMAGEDLLRTMNTNLSVGAAPLLLKESGGEEYFVRAPRVARAGDTLVLTAAGDVRVSVDYKLNNVLTRQVDARRGLLTIQGDENDGKPRVRLVLEEARAADPRRPGSETEHLTLTLPVADGPQLIVPAINENLDGLLGRAHDDYAQSPAVTTAAGALRGFRMWLDRRITVQLYQRAASALSAPFILIFGAILSVFLRRRTPLVVYLLCFLVAAMLVLVTQSGGSLACNQDYPTAMGLTIIWLGVAGLIGVTAFSYRRMARN